MSRVHPDVFARFKRSRERHKCLGCLRGEPSIPGDDTLAREIEALDPHGLLSLAESVGPERAARLLEVRVGAVEGGDGGNSRPVCEQCDEEMHPGTLPDGTDAWCCDACGWSEDREAP